MKAEKSIKSITGVRQIWHKYHLYIISSANLVILMLNILFLSLLAKEAEKAVLIRSELMAHQLQQQSSQKLQIDLKNTADKQSKIYAMLPTQSRILDVIQVFEDLKNLQINVNFSFQESTPLADADGFPYIPVSLNLEGSLPQAMAAVSKLKASPLLFYPTHTVIESSEGLSQNIRVNLFLRLYVSQPFAEN